MSKRNATDKANVPANNASSETEEEVPAAEDASKAPMAQEELSRGISRRSWLLGIGGVAVLCALGGIRFAGATPLVRPPGGQDYDRLIAGCIRCEKCVEICPREVIKPAHIEDGIIGLRTPVLNFASNYCDWCEEEHNGMPLCTEVCPTEALKLTQEARVETTLLGLAELDTETCLAYRDIGCRFCYDACPYEAMGLDTYNRPFIINENCNGCGACETVCVSLENGSISSSGISKRAVIVRALDDKGNMVGIAGQGSDLA